MINEEVKQHWEDYYYPTNYYVKDGVIYKMQNGQEYFVCGTPFILIGKTPELSNGSRFYMIRYAFDDEQKEFIVKSTDLQTKKKCAEILSGHSFILNDGREFQRVTTYILDCQLNYGAALKIIYATEQNGWNEDFSVFAIGKEGITKDGLINIHTTLTNTKHIDVFKRCGTEENWINFVKPVLEQDVARFLFYDSMTAPLLKILNLEPHTFEHTGKTSQGKTTISRIIASAIGNPTEQLYIVGNTGNGILGHIKKMCDIPTFIEEATTKRAKEVVKSVIYEIANGMEKTRAQIDGNMRDDIKTFKAVTHITCEGSIREDMDHAGEILRLNSMTAQLPTIEKISNIRRGIEENYGFFFIRYIQEILKNKENLELKYAEFFNYLTIEDGENRNILERSRDLYTGIMVAGWLCEKVFEAMGLEKKDFKEIVVKYFNECVKGDSVELDHIRALSKLNNWVSQNEMSFLNGDDEIPDMRIKEIYGVLKGNQIRIVDNQFQKIMKEWGFNSPNNIIKCLFEEKILIAKEGSKGKKKFRMGSSVLNGIVIDKAQMEMKLGLIDVED